MRRSLSAGCLLLALALPGVAAEADNAWNAIVALDAGPQRRARSAEEVQAVISAHLAAQEKALRSFLSAFPGDERAFEARLRLARLLAMRGEMKRDAVATREAETLLDQLGKIADPEQRAHVDFTRISMAMRRLNKPTSAERDNLLTRVQNFRGAHPEDRRGAALLAEVATLFDPQPKTKRKLLTDALSLADDEELKARIGDDLRRLDLLGEKLEFTAPNLAGTPVDLASFRGRVVLLCFFAVWSEPSLQALEAVKKSVGNLPKDQLQIVGISLDTKPAALAGLIQAKGISWPVLCDNQGWESAALRGLGINALPTVWLLDRAGKLRSLNALENTAGQVRQILAER